MMPGLARRPTCNSRALSRGTQGAGQSALPAGQNQTDRPAFGLVVQGQADNLVGFRRRLAACNRVDMLHTLNNLTEHSVLALATKHPESR